MKPGAKKWLKRFRTPLFLFLFLLLFAFLIKRQALDLDDFLRLNPWVLAAWFALLPTTWWLNGQKLKTLLKHLNFSISGQEAFQISAASSLLNYLPLQGGAAARGAYLKAKLGLPIKRYVSLLGGIYVVMIATQLGIGLLFCISEFPQRGFVLLSLLFFLPLMATLVIAFFRMPQRLTAWLAKGQFHPIVEIHERFLEILRDRHCIGRLILFEIGVMGVEIIKIALAFSLLGLQETIPLKAYVLMATLTLPTVLLNITPAGLGIRESAIALVALPFHFSVEKAFLAASLDRLLTLAVTFTLGLALTWRLMEKLLKKPQD